MDKETPHYSDPHRGRRKMTTFRLPIITIEQIEAAAKRDKTTRADVIVRAVESISSSHARADQYERGS
jgi:hypothetical protein